MNEYTGFITTVDIIPATRPSFLYGCLWRSARVQSLYGAANKRLVSRQNRVRQQRYDGDDDNNERFGRRNFRKTELLLVVVVVTGATATQAAIRKSNV